MFHKTGPIVFFAMEHLGVVDEEELDHVCSERETALDRPLHQWEREVIHLHLRNEHPGPTILGPPPPAAQDLVVLKIV